MSGSSYDAVLLVSFGGPEGLADVMPFLRNVLKGRNVPESRMLEVAHHYELFGGISPLNAQNRDLISALREELAHANLKLPVYWGNRNWHPFLLDTLRQMQNDGVRHALGFFTSAYSSYSGCRQYREDIERARQTLGFAAPQVDKLRAFYNHPGFIEPSIENLSRAFARIPSDRRPATCVAFTAHSIPSSMAQNCDYQHQLKAACKLVADGVGHLNWSLVYQSRSGPPGQPWLEPDILEHLTNLERNGVKDVIIAPIGFISDHLEIVFDLDTAARQHCESIGLNMIRCATVGCHPRFVSMIRELIEERLHPNSLRLALGDRGPSHDVCPVDCCPMVSKFREGHPA